jgi:hypothetical protein
MKCSDNGWVDPKSKTVCFPDYLRPAMERKDPSGFSGGSNPLAGWSCSSWPPKAQVVAVGSGPPGSAAMSNAPPPERRIVAESPGRWTVIERIRQTEFKHATKDDIPIPELSA